MNDIFLIFGATLLALGGVAIYCYKDEKKGRYVPRALQQGIDQQSNLMIRASGMATAAAPPVLVKDALLAGSAFDVPK